MRHHTFMRHSLTLLASAMAAAVSGQALGETAGKVSFVIGNVTASTPDGQSRSLRRGDAINGGDRIETRGGRLQIRFSDGGFVALQPNTVFGVDQYLYANKPPEETSLFFSLLRGGMRTVTGAIGKVNKQSYKVRTPVATIGIRGTGYRASTDDKRTLVSVGRGLVIVENVLGNVIAGAGQNIVAVNGAPPALSTESVDTPATSPEGDNEEDQYDTSQDTPIFGDQTLPDGSSFLGACSSGVCTPNPDYVTLVEGTALLNSDPITGSPAYSVATPWMSQAESGLAATFAPSSQGPQLLSSGVGGPYPVAVFDAGTLQFHDVRTVGNISWGEFTNGEATVSGSLLSSPLLSATEYSAYVIGTTPLNIIQPSVSASYILQGGTKPRLNKVTEGTLLNFVMDIDFVRSKLDVELNVAMSGETYTASGSDLYVYTLNQSSVFSLTGLNTVSDGGSCASFCSTDINGFFADSTLSQIGASYRISTLTSNITGAAGLAQTSSTPYYFGSLALGPTSPGSFNFLQTNIQSQFGSSGGLARVVDSYGSTLIDSGTLQYSGLGSQDGLTWGEFTNGTPSLDDIGGGALTLDATQFHPYIFGAQSASLLGQDKVTYTKQGHTVPRLNQGMASAALTNFSITIDFDFALMDVALGLTATDPNSGPLTANITGTGMNVSDIFLDGAFYLNTSTQGQLIATGSVCGSGCSADIGGFFSGTGGTQIGAAYSFNYDDGLGGSSITGVAALGIGVPVANTGALPDGQLYTLTKTVGTALSGGYFTGNPSDAALKADFAANGALISAMSSSLPPPLSNSGALVADVGTNKTLSWGRFYGGNIYVDSASTPTLLGSTESAHYVIGQETPSGIIDSLLYYGGGIATYNLGGHTTPTSFSTSGTLTSGQLAVNFDTAEIGVDMVVTMPTITYSVSDTLSFSQSQFSGSALNTTLTAGTGCFSGCSTNINGFFSGQQAQQIGLTYTITDITTIDGAATFVRQP